MRCHVFLAASLNCGSSQSLIRILNCVFKPTTAWSRQVTQSSPSTSFAFVAAESKVFGFTVWDWYEKYNKMLNISMFVCIFMAIFWTKRNEITGSELQPPVFLTLPTWFTCLVRDFYYHSNRYINITLKCLLMLCQSCLTVLLLEKNTYFH